MKPSLTVPPPGCDLDGLVDVLERVESLPAAGCGAFLFAGQQGERGTVYVEQGRVCWAAVRGMGHRLTSHVVRHAEPEVTRAEIEALYAACRSDGAPWGQTLVEKGLLTPEGLRGALARHSAEAIAQIASWPRTVCEWADRDGSAYDAMFTFSPLELAGLVGGFFHPEAADAARAGLRAVTPIGCTGAAYIWPETARDQLPVAVFDDAERPLVTALDLGRWAHNQIELARAVTEQCSPVTAIAASGEAIIAWTWEAGFCAVICDSFQSMARALSNHARAVGAAETK